MTEYLKKKQLAKAVAQAIRFLEKQGLRVSWPLAEIFVAVPTHFVGAVFLRPSGAATFTLSSNNAGYFFVFLSVISTLNGLVF